MRECFSCRRHSPAYRRAHAVGAYEGVLKDAVRALKFDGVHELAGVLGGMMAQVILSASSAGTVPEEGAVVVPVPAHVMRQRPAVLDHAALLALAVGDRLECDVALEALVRVRSSRRQVGLHPAQRRANVDGVFRATTVVVGRYVLLVDDVHTTGATVGACAAALRCAGARNVDVVTVARALPRGSGHLGAGHAARQVRAHSSFEGRDGRL